MYNLSFVSIYNDKTLVLLYEAFYSYDYRESERGSSELF